VSPFPSGVNTKLSKEHPAVVDFVIPELAAVGVDLTRRDL